MFIAPASETTPSIKWPRCHTRDSSPCSSVSFDRGKWINLGGHNDAIYACRSAARARTLPRTKWSERQPVPTTLVVHHGRPLDGEPALELQLGTGAGCGVGADCRSYARKLQAHEACVGQGRRLDKVVAAPSCAGSHPSWRGSHTRCLRAPGGRRGVAQVRRLQFVSCCRTGRGFHAPPAQPTTL